MVDPRGDCNVVVEEHLSGTTRLSLCGIESLQGNKAERASVRSVCQNGVYWMKCFGEGKTRETS